MITNSNGNTVRDLTSIAAVSYCPRSPVPVSPIMAKRTEFCAVGASVSPATAGEGGAAVVGGVAGCVVTGAVVRGGAWVVVDCAGVAQAIASIAMGRFKYRKLLN